MPRLFLEERHDTEDVCMKRQTPLGHTVVPVYSFTHPQYRAFVREK